LRRKRRTKRGCNIPSSHVRYLALYYFAFYLLFKRNTELISALEDYSDKFEIDRSESLFEAGCSSYSILLLASDLDKG